MKKERYSFGEMEFVAVEFAKECLRGFEGSFEDYFNSLDKRWRKIFKHVSKQETNIKDFHRMVTTPYLLVKKSYISEVTDNNCGCGQPSCTFGCN